MDTAPEVTGRSGAGGAGGLSSFAPVGALVPAAAPTGAPQGESRARGRAHAGHSAERSAPGSPLTRTVRDIVEVVPDSLKAAIAALAALTLMLASGWLFFVLRSRRLERQRRELLQEVGLLQSALLPQVPERLGGLRTSVAYRPAEGVGAGGDFYDVLVLPDGRTAFVLGDISGHGRAALAHTAFMRYTLRAYLEAGLEPRIALQVAGRVIEGNLAGDFATVLLAVHDKENGSLTFASAGHPAPIVIGPSEYEPVTAASSPPIGVGLRTGLRQTTLPLPSGSVACLYTDGLTEARTTNGVLGRWWLAGVLREMGRDATAEHLLDRVARAAGRISDDMAACVLTPAAGVTSGGFRTEQLELDAREASGPLPTRFLDACGVEPDDAEAAIATARAVAQRFGGAILHVVIGNRRHVEVLPRNVHSIEAASRRVAAG